VKPDIICSRLRRDRLQAGLRLRDVSNGSGVAVSKLSEAERGLVRLSPEEAIRVRAAIPRSRGNERQARALSPTGAPRGAA